MTLIWKKNYYKRYCRILTSAIKPAKKRYYNSILTYSNNKSKTTWNVIENTSNIKPIIQNITSFNVNGNLPINGQIIAETFNKYFASVAQNMHVNNHNANAYLIMKILYLTYPGHLIIHSLLSILSMYHIKKRKS